MFKENIQNILCSNKIYKIYLIGLLDSFSIGYFTDPNNDELDDYSFEKTSNLEK